MLSSQTPDTFAYTPLRNISNFSQLLGQGYGDALDAKALDYVDQIAENSRRAQAQLAGLLQYARLDNVPLVVAPVNCRALPEVRADAQRLETLFYCLISNALKFCQERADITISVQRGHKTWLFCVADKGIGIPAENHESIFGLFTRLHENTYSGTGMGLALARKIIQLHGGDIWVESAPGEGAHVYFTLPDSASAAR